MDDEHTPLLRRLAVSLSEGRGEEGWGEHPLVISREPRQSHVDDLPQVRMRARGRVVVRVDGLVPADDEHTALLRRLAAFGGDPGHPAGQHRRDRAQVATQQRAQHRQRRLQGAEAQTSSAEEEA